MLCCFNILSLLQTCHIQDRCWLIPCQTFPIITVVWVYLGYDPEMRSSIFIALCSTKHFCPYQSSVNCKTLLVIWDKGAITQLYMLVLISFWKAESRCRSCIACWSLHTKYTTSRVSLCDCATVRIMKINFVFVMQHHVAKHVYVQVFVLNI